MDASRHGRKEVVDVLVNAGANLDICDKVRLNGRRSFVYVVSSYHVITKQGSIAISMYAPACDRSRLLMVCIIGWVDRP